MKFKPLSQPQSRTALTVLFLFFVLLTGNFRVPTTHGQDHSKNPEATKSPISLDEYLAPEMRYRVPSRASDEDADLEPLANTATVNPQDTDPNAATPVINKVQPKEVAVGGPDFRLRVNGDNFKKGAVVLINGNPVDTIFSNFRNLLASVSASVVANLGTISVTAKNPDGTVTKPDTFTVVAGNPAVVITDLQPRIVLEGIATFGMRVHGDGFRGSPFVRVGGQKVTTQVNRTGDDGLLVAVVDGKDVAHAGTVPIQVDTNNGVSKIFNLIIAPAPPRIDSTDPIKIDLNSKDTVVKVKGRNFTSKSRVLVNDSEVPSVFMSDTRIDATLSAALFTKIQQLEVVVDIPNEGTSDISLIAVAAEDPYIFGLSPTRVAAGETDFNVGIEGVNLSKTNKKTKVYINGKSVEFTATNAKEVTAKVKKELVASPGTITITVQLDNAVSNTSSLIVEAADNVTSLAGDIPGFKDGTGDKAWFTRPSRAAVAPDGMVYIADQLNHSVRQYNPATEAVITVAGDGFPGYVDTVDVNTSDKNKDNDKVRFNNPLGVAVDRFGIIYVTDFGNDVIRRIKKDGSSFVVDSFAGENRLRTNDDTGFKERVGLSGYKDDDNPAQARFSGPDGIVAGPDGRLYIADAFNQLIRVITPAGIAGTGVTSLFGNQFPGLVDGTGAGVRFNTPTGLAISGNTLLVADFGNNRIRKIDLSIPRVSTLTGVAGQGNADGPRFVAKLNGPLGVAIRGDQVFVVDNLSNRVRRVETTGEISTVAGSVEDFADGPGPKARFRTPRDLGILSSDKIYVVDQGNQRFRQMSF